MIEINGKNGYGLNMIREYESYVMEEIGSKKGDTVELIGSNMLVRG